MMLERVGGVGKSCHRPNYEPSEAMSQRAGVARTTTLPAHRPGVGRDPKTIRAALPTFSKPLPD